MDHRLPPTSSVVYVFFSRSADVPTRQRYVALVESVKEGGGAVKVFSSLHVSGERKKRLSEAI